MNDSAYWTRKYRHANINFCTRLDLITSNLVVYLKIDFVLSSPKHQW